MNPSYFLTDLATEITIPEKGILSHTLYNDESVKIVIFGFSAGHELTAHTAPMPATIQFLQGEATLTLGTDTREVTAGTFIHMQSQLVHGIVAKTPVLMLLTLVKAARQDQPPRQQG